MKEERRSGSRMGNFAPLGCRGRSEAAGSPLFSAEESTRGWVPLSSFQVCAQNGGRGARRVRERRKRRAVPEEGALPGGGPERCTWQRLCRATCLGGQGEEQPGPAFMNVLAVTARGGTRPERPRRFCPIRVAEQGCPTLESRVWQEEGGRCPSHWLGRKSLPWLPTSQNQTLQRRIPHFSGLPGVFWGVFSSSSPRELCLGTSGKSCTGACVVAPGWGWRSGPQPLFSPGKRSADSRVGAAPVRGSPRPQPGVSGIARAEVGGPAGSLVLCLRSRVSAGGWDGRAVSAGPSQPQRRDCGGCERASGCDDFIYLSSLHTPPSRRAGTLAR
ncbi:uncharacterized protein LOC104679844 [Rhinopithecus roxellana]|uniref:uncharacterized protein LOC104679844 n=1 Tax=Rhinopithecus roxellana TaxID=61622 RepID=UPI001237955C|nr:uncharacterized protein LOC104679844 [Rhinopithecus roxellana]